MTINTDKKINTDIPKWPLIADVKKGMLEFVEEHRERIREQAVIKENYPNLYRIIMYGEYVTEEEAIQYEEYERIRNRSRSSCYHGNNMSQCNICRFE